MVKKTIPRGQQEIIVQGQMIAKISDSIVTITAKIQSNKKIIRDIARKAATIGNMADEIVEMSSLI